MEEVNTAEKPIYPEGYDNEGISRYYNYEAVARSLTCARLTRTRVLRFGSVDDLRLVDVALPDVGTKVSELPPPQYALKEYIRTSFGERKVPVYIFDEHNHAFFAWCEAYKEGHILGNSQLLHFDDHSDGKKIKYFPPGSNWSLAEAARVAQSTEFDSFIHPAILLGLVKDISWIQNYGNKYYSPETESGIGTWVMKSEDIPVPIDSKRTIVDIDIDYFDYFLRWGKNLEVPIEEVRQLMKSAGIITIATSPGIMENQEKTIEIIKTLLSK